MNVITADMILRPGRLHHTPTCWSCRHRIEYTPKQRAKLPTRPYERCVDGYIIDWGKVRVCERNPTAVYVKGAIYQCCGLWELDSAVWHSPREQVYEYRIRVSRTSRMGGQTTLEGYRCPWTSSDGRSPPT